MSGLFHPHNRLGDETFSFAYIPPSERADTRKPGDSDSDSGDDDYMPGGPGEIAAINDKKEPFETDDPEAWATLKAYQDTLHELDEAIAKSDNLYEKLRNEQEKQAILKELEDYSARNKPKIKRITLTPVASYVPNPPVVIPQLEQIIKAPGPRNTDKLIAYGNKIHILQAYLDMPRLKEERPETWKEIEKEQKNAKYGMAAVQSDLFTLNIETNRKLLDEYGARKGEVSYLNKQMQADVKTRIADYENGTTEDVERAISEGKRSQKLDELARTIDSLQKEITQTQNTLAITATKMGVKQFRTKVLKPLNEKTALLNAYINVWGRYSNSPATYAQPKYQLTGYIPVPDPDNHNVPELRVHHWMSPYGRIQVYRHWINLLYQAKSELDWERNGYSNNLIDYEINEWRKKMAEEDDRNFKYQDEVRAKKLGEIGGLQAENMYILHPLLKEFASGTGLVFSPPGVTKKEQYATSADTQQIRDSKHKKRAAEILRNKSPAVGIPVIASPKPSPAVMLRSPLFATPKTPSPSTTPANTTTTTTTRSTPKSPTLWGPIQASVINVAPANAPLETTQNQYQVQQLRKIQRPYLSNAQKSSVYTDQFPLEIPMPAYPNDPVLNNRTWESYLRNSVAIRANFNKMFELTAQGYMEKKVLTNEKRQITKAHKKIITQNDFQARNNSRYKKPIAADPKAPHNQPFTAPDEGQDSMQWTQEEVHEYRAHKKAFSDQGAMLWYLYHIPEWSAYHEEIKEAEDKLKYLWASWKQKFDVEMTRRLEKEAEAKKNRLSPQKSPKTPSPVKPPKALSPPRGAAPKAAPRTPTPPKAAPVKPRTPTPPPAPKPKSPSPKRAPSPPPVAKPETPKQKPPPPAHFADAAAANDPKVVSSAPDRSAAHAERLAELKAQYNPLLEEQRALQAKHAAQKEQQLKEAEEKRRRDEAAAKAVADPMPISPPGSPRAEPKPAAKVAAKAEPEPAAKAAPKPAAKPKAKAKAKAAAKAAPKAEAKAAHEGTAKERARQGLVQRAKEEKARWKSMGLSHPMRNPVLKTPHPLRPPPPAPDLRDVVTRRREAKAKAKVLAAHQTIARLVGPRPGAPKMTGSVVSVSKRSKARARTNPTPKPKPKPKAKAKTAKKKI